MADSQIVYHDSFAYDPNDVPPADAAIATMWTTAYYAAPTPGQTRRFYLIQDFEPMFYPAGTLYALAEHSYRMGLYGLCNTGHLADIYRDRYGGGAKHFWPAVDGSIFHSRGRTEPDPDRPVTVFIYARPGHMRNCWELAARAVRLVKDQLADNVRIVTAGSWAFPEHMDALITHMGQLDYRETGPLYRSCDIGVRPHDIGAPLLSAAGAHGLWHPSGGFREPGWGLAASPWPKLHAGAPDRRWARRRDRRPGARPGPAPAAGRAGPGRHRRPPRPLGPEPVRRVRVPVRTRVPPVSSKRHRSERVAGREAAGLRMASITGPGGVLEIWGYRELIGRLVQRELGSRYKRSVLGWLWSMLNPAATLAIYALVFGVLLKFDPSPGGQRPLR